MKGLYKSSPFVLIKNVLNNMKNIKLILTKEKLYKHLIEEYLSYENVASIYNVCRNTIRKLTKEYNIKIPKNITQLAREKTNIKKYGYKTPLKNDMIKQKAEQTSLLKYNCKRAADYIEYRKKAGQNIKKTRIKNHTTNKELLASLEIYKDGLTRKEIFNKKRNNTLHKNNTFGKSKEEIYILKLLQNKFKEVNYQYLSEEYPFPCDFYIPKINTYIEYQGYWTHGKYNNKIIGKYDKNNLNHITILNEWKEKAKQSIQYKNAIEIWTKRDPLKRQTAKENGLNWLEFFTLEEFINWYNSI